MLTNHLITRPSFILAACLVVASLLSNPALASERLRPGADIDSKELTIIRLEQDTPLVEVDDRLCRPLALPDPALAWDYPLLPDLSGADINDEVIIIHLEYDTPLVEVDGQLYRLDGPIDVAIDLDRLTVIIIVPPNSGVFVTENGRSAQEFDSSFTSTMLAFDMFGASASSAVPEFGFAIALPGQPLPTVPDVVLRPTNPNPK